jgi:hypothetical protein
MLSDVAGFNSPLIDGLVVERSGGNDLAITIATDNSRNGCLVFADSNSSNPAWINYDHSVNEMSFKVNAFERARIDNSGRLLVGTSSSNSVLNKTIELHSAGHTFNQPAYEIYCYADLSSHGGYFNFCKTRATSIGSNTIVASEDTLGYIRWQGANGIGYDIAAEIKAQIDGVPGASNDMPGRLVFSTTADGASSPTERMKIDSSGNINIDSGTVYVDAVNNRFGIGTTSPVTKLDVRQPSSDAGYDSTAILFNGDDSANIWRGAFRLRHNLDTTIVSGSSIGIAFEPLSSTGGGFYGAAGIKAVRENATANNQDTALTFSTRKGSSDNTVNTEKLRIDSSGRVTMPFQPAFSVWFSGNQSIAHNTITKVQFNVEVFDVGGNFDSATNYRFTAPVAGKYLFMGHLYIYPTYHVEVYIYKNGSQYKRFSGPLGTGSNDNPNGMDFLDIINLAVNDYVEIYGYHGSVGGSSASIYGGGIQESSFVGYLLG